MTRSAYRYRWYRYR